MFIWFLPEVSIPIPDLFPFSSPSNMMKSEPPFPHCKGPPRRSPRSPRQVPRQRRAHRFRGDLLHRNQGDAGPRARIFFQERLARPHQHPRQPQAHSHLLPAGLLLAVVRQRLGLVLSGARAGDDWHHQECRAGGSEWRPADLELHCCHLGGVQH